MFERLFAESGLSLDRLRALLEVGAAGSIVKAAGGDAVRQSQYSRQIKQLENFFRVKLVERQGRVTRLTPQGRELTRISRFFMLGLSNFQRGCLAEGQTFRIGGSASFLQHYLLPVLSGITLGKDDVNYATEVLGDGDIERRLHDLTLDFGLVGKAVLSRPLQTKLLREWKLELWMPKAMRFTEANAARAFKERRLPLVLAEKELVREAIDSLMDYEAQFVCGGFLEARAVMEGHRVAGLLPDFLAPEKSAKEFVRISVPEIEAESFSYYLAWNPRLLRLNPHAVRRRDLLISSFAAG